VETRVLRISNRASSADLVLKDLLQHMSVAVEFAFCTVAPASDAHVWKGFDRSPGLHPIRHSGDLRSSWALGTGLEMSIAVSKIREYVKRRLV